MKILIRFGSFVPLLLLFLFLNSPFGSAQNMQVSGAGVSVVDGIYVLDGIISGKNKYTQAPSAEHLIYFNSGSNLWFIAPTETPLIP